MAFKRNVFGDGFFFTFHTKYALDLLLMPAPKTIKKSHLPCSCSLLCFHFSQQRKPPLSLLPHDSFLNGIFPNIFLLALCMKGVEGKRCLPIKNQLKLPSGHGSFLPQSLATISRQFPFMLFSHPQMSPFTA